MKKFLAILVSATTAVSLAGCTININTPTNPESSSEQAASQFSASDLMFAQMMIPHHEQAVEMATLAETRAKSNAVIMLAAEIKDEQAPEIAQMNGWLTSAGVSADGGGHMGHDMGGGMLSEAEMAKLEAASGEIFDRLFLQGMIAHHEGAIQMAQMIINSKNSEAKALAEAIVKSQSKQIEYMKELLG